MKDIRDAAEKAGMWPIRGYVSDAMLTAWGRRNPSWVDTTAGNVRYVAPADDITYSLMGMLLLEKGGANFTHEDMRSLWIENMPIYLCWGPERNILLKAGLASLTNPVTTGWLPGSWERPARRESRSWSRISGRVWY